MIWTASGAFHAARICGTSVMWQAFAMKLAVAVAAVQSVVLALRRRFKGDSGDKTVLLAQ